MSLLRRRWLSLAGAAIAVAAAPRVAMAAEPRARRLQNRLELWANYARRSSKNLLARITTTRETSLLDEPLVATGTLAFLAPATLVLRDDGLTGSTTLIDDGDLLVQPNQPDMPRGPEIDPREHEAAAWLADRLIRCFAPSEDDEALIEGARVDVPKGRGYRLELRPVRGSVVRQLLRSMTIHFDPVGGAVTEILIAEAQGDRLRIQVTDHRQNVEDEDTDRILDEARKLRK
jgi:hypothetical protein